MIYRKGQHDNQILAQSLPQTLSKVNLNILSLPLVKALNLRPDRQTLKNMEFIPNEGSDYNIPERYPTLRDTLKSHPFPMIAAVSGILIIHLILGGIAFQYLEQESHIKRCELADQSLNFKLLDILKHMQGSGQLSRKVIMEKRPTANFTKSSSSTEKPEFTTEAAENPSLTNNHELTEMFHVFEILKDSGATVEILDERDDMNDTMKLSKIVRTYYSSINSSSTGTSVNTNKSELPKIRTKTKFKVNCPVKWHFFDSMLFSLVTITTIGYGHQVPKTHNGQMFCLVYAATGIPLIGFFVYYWTKGVNILDRVHWQRWLFMKHNDDCTDEKKTGDQDCGCDSSFKETATDELSPHRLLPFLIVWYVMPTLLFWLAERHVQGWDLFTAFYSGLKKCIRC